METYVIARTAAGRPTLQHVFRPGDTTACGLNVADWSRAYQRAPIPQIVCQRCLVAAAKNPRLSLVTRRTA